MPDSSDWLSSDWLSSTRYRSNADELDPEPQFEALDDEVSLQSIEPEDDAGFKSPPNCKSFINKLYEDYLRKALDARKDHNDHLDRQRSDGWGIMNHHHGFPPIYTNLSTGETSYNDPFQGDCEHEGGSKKSEPVSRSSQTIQQHFISYLSKSLKKCQRSEAELDIDLLMIRSNPTEPQASDYPDNLTIETDDQFGHANRGQNEHEPILIGIHSPSSRENSIEPLIDELASDLGLSVSDVACQVPSLPVNLSTPETILAIVPVSTETDKPTPALQVKRHSVGPETNKSVVNQPAFRELIAHAREETAHSPELVLSFTGFSQDGRLDQLLQFVNTGLDPKTANCEELDPPKPSRIWCPTGSRGYPWSLWELFLDSNLPTRNQTQRRNHGPPQTRFVIAQYSSNQEREKAYGCFKQTVKFQPKFYEAPIVIHRGLMPEDLQEADLLYSQNQSEPILNQILNKFKILIQFLIDQANLRKNLNLKPIWEKFTIDQILIKIKMIDSNFILISDDPSSPKHRHQNQNQKVLENYLIEAQRYGVMNRFSSENGKDKWQLTKLLRNMNGLT